MTANYQHLALAQVQPGMVLSDELLDAHGHVLLPQGTRLTEAMLAAMPRHDVETLPILTVPPLAGAAQDQEKKRERERDRDLQRRRLSRLFRKHDPAMEGERASGELRQFIEHFHLGNAE